MPIWRLPPQPQQRQVRRTGAAYALSCADGLTLGDLAVGGRVYNIAVVDGIKGGDASLGKGVLSSLASDGVKMGEFEFGGAFQNGVFQ